MISLHKLRFLSVLAAATCLGIASSSAVTRVRCCGDSITLGLKASSSSTSYPSVLQGLLGTANYVVYNSGHSGDCALQNGSRPYPMGVSPRDDADIVVFMLGTNDSDYANWPLKASFISDYTNLVNSYANLESHPRMYICLPPPIYKTENTSAWSNVNLNEALPMITQVAENTKATIIDVHGAFLGHPEWLSDQVHPNDTGYSVLANLVFDELTSGHPKPGKYKVGVRHSGKYLDCRGRSSASGTAIQQWSYSGIPSEQWNLVSLGGGEYKIIGVASGLSLEVQGESTADSAIVQLLSYSGMAGQKWAIKPTDSGYFEVSNVKSGKAMDVSGVSTADGANVIQYAYHAGLNQQWDFLAP